MATAILRFMDDKEVWEGEPAQLLETLDSVAEAHRINTKCSSWPRAAHILTRRLNEVRTNLSATGILVEQSRGQRRILTISKRAQTSVETVESVAGGEGAHKEADTHDDAMPDALSVDEQAASQQEPRIRDDHDAIDAPDADSQSFSESKVAHQIRKLLENRGLPFEIAPGQTILSVEPYATVEARAALSPSPDIRRPARARLMAVGIDLAEADQLGASDDRR